MAQPQSTLPLSESEAAIQRFGDYLYARCTLAGSTINNYIGALRRALPNIGVQPTAAIIEHYISDLRRAGAGCSHITIIAVALEAYMRMLGTPIRLGRPPKENRLPKDVLNEAEVTLMIAATNTSRERAMLAVLAFSGMRNEEFVKLKVGDVSIGSQTIHVAGKGAKDRNVCVSGSCIEALVAQRAKIRKRVHPHLLRHSLATNMLLRGASILTIRDQLGHEFLESTMKYIHVTTSQLQRDYRINTPCYM